MRTLRITFLWEDDEGISYDDMFEQLMFLGADNIEEEEVKPEPEPKRQAHPKRQNK